MSLVTLHNQKVDNGIHNIGDSSLVLNTGNYHPGVPVITHLLSQICRILAGSLLGDSQATEVRVLMGEAVQGDVGYSTNKDSMLNDHKNAANKIQILKRGQFH